jgi:hypothetical protein
MSKGNTTENNFVDFVFNATAMPAYGAILYISYHTADPGEAGTQLTNEAAYPDYARVGIVRTSAGWTVTGNQSTNLLEATFPECNASFGASTETETHIGIGTAATGAGQLLYKGALTQSIIVSALQTPRFPIGSIIVQED